MINKFLRWNKKKCWNRYRCHDCIYLDGIWSEDGLFLKGFKCTRNKNMRKKLR